VLLDPPVLEVDVVVATVVVGPLSVVVAGPLSTVLFVPVDEPPVDAPPAVAL
jgi:hypothetical protein